MDLATDGGSACLLVTRVINTVPEAKGAIDGLVAQSKALMLKWLREQCAPGGSYAGSGRYVYENFGAERGRIEGEDTVT